jgi:hypothetical protein
VWTILAEDSAALSDIRVDGENGVTSSAWVDWSRQWGATLITYLITDGAAPVAVCSQYQFGVSGSKKGSLARSEIVLAGGGGRLGSVSELRGNKLKQ